LVIILAVVVLYFPSVSIFGFGFIHLSYLFNAAAIVMMISGVVVGRFEVANTSDKQGHL